MLFNPESSTVGVVNIVAFIVEREVQEAYVCV